MKYIITGSTGADIQSFFPILKLDIYDTLLQATQAAVSLINHNLTKFGDDFHLKTGNLSWEILDSNNNSWERIQTKKINTYEKKKNTQSIDIDSLHRLFDKNKEIMNWLKKIKYSTPKEFVINMEPLTFIDTINQHALIIAELPLKEHISNYYLIDQDNISKNGTIQIQYCINNVDAKNRQQAIQQLTTRYDKHIHPLVSLDYFDEYTILKDYLESICEALLNNEHQKVNRLLNTTTEQFAAKNKQTQLQEEFTNFCEFAADELDDNMGWYFFNENLPRYVKEWQKEKLIEL